MSVLYFNYMCGYLRIYSAGASPFPIAGGPETQQVREGLQDIREEATGGAQNGSQ